MQFAFFIQARLGSSRLPRKILLPFYQGETILDLLIKKLLHIHANVVLATSGKSSVSCPLKPSDSAPLKHSTMPP